MIAERNHLIRYDDAAVDELITPDRPIGQWLIKTWPRAGEASARSQLDSDDSNPANRVPFCQFRFRKYQGKGIDTPVPGQSSEFSSAYRFQRPTDAYEFAPGLENTPNRRVTLVSNERNFLSLTTPILPKLGIIRLSYIFTFGLNKSETFLSLNTLTNLGVKNTISANVTKRTPISITTPLQLYKKSDFKNIRFSIVLGERSNDENRDGN